MRNYISSLENKEVLLATKHKKEEVISPLFQSHFSAKIIVPQDYDTDVFGTFTGEVERTKDPLSTLRQKALTAMEKFNFDLAIASEGSFGPHPLIPFMPADEELLIFIDKNEDLAIVVKHVSTNTNYASQEVKTLSELSEFADRVEFPTHALILKNSSTGEIHKGIRDKNQLINSFNLLYQFGLPLTVETDMRAVFNPTRMKVIKETTEKLIQKILSQCPSCFTPGFSIESLLPGLPCLNCGLPTKSAKKAISRCGKCKYENEVLFPLKREAEDPMCCDYCNP